jgi:hypothetical protein
MKMFVFVLAVLGYATVTSYAGVAVIWTTTYGAYAHDAPNVVDYGTPETDATALLHNHGATWQLIYAGPDGVPNPVSLVTGGPNGDHVTGDDVVWRQRDIPMGGNLGGVPCPADGTTWDFWMGWSGVEGVNGYVNYSWNTAGYVFQRVYEGTPTLGSWYFESPLLALHLHNVGSGEPPQGFSLDTPYHGFQPDQQIQPTQVITFPPIGDQLITNTIGLSATASSGLPVVFAVGSGPASISNGTDLSFSGTGTVSIVASQGGDTNWNAAPNVTNTFTVLGLTFELFASAGLHGRIMPSGIIRTNQGANAAFVIQPDAYYHVQNIWTNGGSAGTATNFIWCNISAPGTVTVSFAETLATHGTPHWWLAQWGWTDDFDTVESLDQDGDGLHTWQEYPPSTCPTNANTDGDQYDDGVEVNAGADPLHDDFQTYGAILNQPSAFNLYTSNSVLDLSCGEVMLSVVSNHIQVRLTMQSTDLLDRDGWTNAGSAVEWECPVAPNKSFFRFLGAPGY